jgi:hypothetical protein
VDPESPVAHNFYTYHQLEELCDPTGAMIRLLGFISKGSTDANYWAGLVPVLRFLGLYRASLAAHKRASVLSPRIQTGVLHTHLQLGEYEWVAERATEPFLTASVLATMGRDREALDLLRNDARTRTGGLRSSFLGSLLAALEGRGEDCERHCRAAIDHGLRDPEAIYFFGRVAARAGRRDLACDIMVSAIDRGFWSIWTLENDPWLAGLHADARFADALVRARAGHREAFDQFRRARGEELLGITEMRH